MKNYPYIFACLIFFIAGSGTFTAQTKQIDSLRQLLLTAKEDTGKVVALTVLSKKFNQTGNYDSSLQFSTAALQLAEKLGFKRGAGVAYNNIASTYHNQGNYPEALKNYLASIKICEQIGFKTGMANSYSNIALIYYNQDNYPESIKNNTIALQLRKDINDKEGIASSYNNIGNMYYRMGNYPEALKSHLSSLKVREELSNKKGISDSYNNIGNIYADQGNYPEALKNYSASLKIRKELGDQGLIASSYINLGSIYYDQGNYGEAIKNYNAALSIQEGTGDHESVAYSYTGIGLVCKDQGNYAEALKNHLAALKIREEMDDKNGMANSYINLEATYSSMKDYSTAEAYGLKALALAKEIGFLEGIRSANQSLSNIYAATGRYRESLESYKAYIAARDSLLNEENTQKTVQTQMQYEFDKKEEATKLNQEKKDAVNAEEKRKQQLIIAAISIGLLLVLILAGVILRSLRLNKKKNRIIEHQKELVEEKHKEITDSINYAERIQRSFLATKELLNENLKEYFVFFQPKDVVSGDFYWAGKLPNNQFALVTADSTGHGVPGAIMSILNISSLEKAVESGIHDPAGILNYARLNIIQRLKKDGSAEGGKDGMDCCLISFDFVGKKMSYAAANNPVWIVRQKKIMEFAPDKMPVGKHDKDQVLFTQHTINLEQGDMIYALTDGMPDQFGGPKGKKYMYRQLKELLISGAGLSMQEQKQRLIDSFSQWKGNLEQVDDVCIIGIRI